MDEATYTCWVKIYTRTGDSGETALLGGKRVSKADPRVAAYGEVDELNAWLGLVRSIGSDAGLAAMLERIQRDLFAIGARLADPGSKVAHRVAKTAVTGDDVKRLEDWIDLLESEVPVLRRFILAGGSPRRRVAARRPHHLPPRRTDGRQSRHRARRARDSRVPEPPVRSAVRHGAGREPTGRCARIRVVSHDRAVARAYAECERLAREHYENFPVASRFLPTGDAAAHRRDLRLRADGRRLRGRARNGQRRAPAPARRLGPAARRGGVRP